MDKVLDDENQHWRKKGNSVIHKGQAIVLYNIIYSALLYWHIVLTPKIFIILSKLAYPKPPPP